MVRNAHAGSRTDAVVREVDLTLSQVRESADQAGKTTAVFDTQCEGDGVRIGQLIAKQLVAIPVIESLDVLIFGGDGTVSEVVNGFMAARKGDATAIRIAVYPSGTANALYAAMYAHDIRAPSKRRSVDALIDSLHSGKKSLRPLSPMVNRLLDKRDDVKQTTYSLLVTSHALHAAILADADTAEMRAAHEGIERFKVAAHQNSTLWIEGSLTLQPPNTSSVLRYSPVTHRFETVDGGRDAPVELQGPFLYLNAMITDRLEEHFVPAPLSSPWSSNDSSLPDDVIDVIAIRPLRDTTLPFGDEARTTFAKTKLMDVQKGMYSRGSHIDLTYTDNGDPTVEYFRCSAYEFRPIDIGSKKAKLVCMDGTMSSADAFRVERHQGPAPLRIWW